jgi:hypothetical protein
VPGHGGSMRVHPLAVLLVAASVTGVVERGEILKVWTEINPGDPARRTALGRCYFENHNFNRFSAAARTTCYQQWLQPSSLSAGNDPSLRAPNPVDLAHAVGEGTATYMPTGDIRKELATELYLNTTH